MRYILIILVFLSVGAKAQMVIKAHANYRPYAQPAANLLLDDYPNAAAAYSLRKLDKDYTGAAIRVRKDTTGQPEQDIGFTASGELDTAALKSFLNARSGLITTWYSQGDSANVNFSQSTQASQPVIATNGVINRLNGKPCVYFFGSNSMAVINSTSKFSFLHKAGKASVFYVLQFGVNANPNALLPVLDNINVDSNPNHGYTFFYQDNGGNNDRLVSVVSRANATTTSTVITASNYAASNTAHLISNILNNDTAIGSQRNFIFRNGANQVNNNTNTSIPSSNNASFNLTLGRNADPNSGSLNYIGYMSEIIIYSNNQFSNRTGIENNINDYYNIYWNGDFTGLLDTYGSSAAAYSLRNLSSTYKGPLIRVRKDTTGQPEMDIYGDYYGNLDTVGLKNFLLTRSGFVTTWYDQSGNAKNIIQTSSVNQPRIGNLGVIDRRNGKPYVYFDGSNDAVGSTDTGLPTGNATYISVSISDNTSLSAGQYRSIFNYGNPQLTRAAFNLYGDDANIGNDGLGVSQYGDGTGISNRLQTLNLLFVTKPSTNGIWNMWINNSLSASKNINTATTLNNGAGSFNVGAFSVPTDPIGSYLLGSIGELIIYGSNQSSNRTGIQNNINSYYGIY